MTSRALLQAQLRRSDASVLFVDLEDCFFSRSGMTLYRWREVDGVWKGEEI